MGASARLRDKLIEGLGRAERIRTSDPLLPKQVRYQAALQPDRDARVTELRAILQAGSARLQRLAQ